jgi:diguanylate cyclase (GGDEF)-like protein
MTDDKQGLSSIIKSDLFTNLLPEEKKAVIDRSGTVLLRKGGILFSPGKKADHLFMLMDGSIRVFKSHEDSGDEEIACFAPGDIIGDFDFARGAEYDATAEALEDSSLIIFPGFGLSLDNFALEAPQIVSRILLNSAAMVTNRIKSTRKLIIKNITWVQELHRKIHEDPGTGLWKQSLLDDELKRLLESPMTLIMLKPDRFKVLVDSNGHEAGDEAMVKIAAVLKGTTRRIGRGWALRFRSNETGILINKCDAILAESLVNLLSDGLRAIPPVPLESGDESEYAFTASIAWSVWPADEKFWNSLFDGTYQLLMDTWKSGGNKIVRYGGGKVQ